MKWCTFAFGVHYLLFYRILVFDFYKLSEGTRCLLYKEFAFYWQLWYSLSLYTQSEFSLLNGTGISCIKFIPWIILLFKFWLKYATYQGIRLFCRLYFPWYVPSWACFRVQRFWRLMILQEGSALFVLTSDNKMNWMFRKHRTNLSCWIYKKKNK